MNRKLNQEEIQHIDEFIFLRGIHYYDLIQELRDHIATEIELSPETDFEEALFQVSKKFTSVEFARILKERSATLRKQWRNRFWSHLADYFTFPKILFTIALCAILLSLSTWINPVLQLLVVVGFQVLAFSELENINYEDLLITKTFRKQISIFFILPFLLFVLDNKLYGAPIHQLGDQLSVGLLIYCIVCSTTIISFWACYKHFFTWVREEVESKYPEYLNLKRS